MVSETIDEAVLATLEANLTYIYQFITAGVFPPHAIDAHWVETRELKVGAAQYEAVTEALAEQELIPLRIDADPEKAWSRIHRSASPIAVLCMDQKIFAGVGNIYRAETLFRNRIDPFMPGKFLRRNEFEALWDDLVELMPLGVRDGRIDTVYPEHTPEAMGRPPRVDKHGGEVYVYRREGQPCLVCGTPVSRKEIGARNLFWCRTCQPRSRRRTVRA